MTICVCSVGGVAGSQGHGLTQIVHDFLQRGNRASDAGWRFGWRAQMAFVVVQDRVVERNAMVCQLGG